MKLDLQAQLALKGAKPQAVWQLVETLVDQAFEEYPEESQGLMAKYQPPVDHEGLLLVLQHLDPVVGINNLAFLNQKVNLADPLKTSPPDVLEEVLKMLTESSKYQSEVST